MQRRLYAGGGGRTVAVVTGGLCAALCFGLLAGYSPVITLGVAVGLLIAVAMFKDLAIGIVVFAVASFAGILATGHGASLAKAVGVLLVIAWVGTFAKRSRQEVRSLFAEHRGLMVCAIALLAWSLLSVAWAQSASTALVGASRWAMDLVLFPIIYAGLKRPAQVRWTTAAFVGGALIAVLYGVATGRMGSYSRLASALDDPEETAAVLVAAAALAFALGASERSGPRRWMGFGAGVAALLGLAATGSRGGLVALGAAVLAAVIMAGRWRRKVATVAAVGAVVVIGWFVFLAPAATLGHVSNLQTGRTTLWTVAGRTIAANPLVGVGNDNFAVTSSSYLIRPGVTNDALQVVTDPKVAHNVFLEVWADLGIVGLVLFVGLLLGSLRCAIAAVRVFQRSDRQREEILARGLVVAIVAMVAADFFMSNLYSKQLFLLLALAPTMLAAARAQTARPRPS